MGYSVGHWDGDTLVVTTDGYNDRSSIRSGRTSAHRSIAHDRALPPPRYRPHGSPGDVREDPKAYTEIPWTLRFQFDLVPDGELIEYICENERDAAHLVGKSDAEVHVPAEVLAQYVGTYDSPAWPTVVAS